MKKTAKLALLVFLALLMGMLLLTACGGSRNGQQFPVGTTDENNEVVETIPVEENIYLSTDEGTAENKKVQSEIDLINDLCRSAYNAENAADLQDYIFGDINGDGKINMDDATKLMRYILKADPCLRHSWQEATCIEPKTCLECGVTEGEPNGHTEVIDAAVEPTCTETGLTEGKHCSVCNEILTEQEEIAATGHTEVIDAAVEPTCTETGLTEGKHCSVCNEVLAAQEEVVSKGHAYTSATTPPTATEDGFITYSCSVCDDSYSEAIVPVEFTVTESNRTQIGYTGKNGENLIIPAVFQEKDGTWYRVVGIGDNAFYYCSNLKSIVIPESVTCIGNSVFYECFGLKSVTISEGVTSIGKSVFAYCSGLTSLVVEKNNSVYYSEENCIIEKATKKLITGCKASIIPSGVTSIGEYAFSACDGLTSIVIPDSVTSIGVSAFRGCRDLISIMIFEGVTSIGDEAFYGCSELTSIVMPDSITSIGNKAFLSCTSLKSIVIPQRVTSIGDGVFHNCYRLESIVIPKSVTSIGTGVFGYCSGLTSLVVDKNNSAYYSEGNCIIEKATKTLIAGCENSVIPDSVTSIGGSAFSYCTSLTSIVIPESVTSIGAWAFTQCSSLTSIVIPEGVTSIGDWAFAHCTSLTSIVIPDSVTSIGDYAFRSCDGLTDVTIGNGVTSIGDYAFYGCSSLTSIVIPEGVTSIEGYAFSFCTRLTIIVISDSVTSIGIRAFDICTSLTGIIFKGTTEQWNAISKGGNWNSSTGRYAIYCTDGTLSK